jgi:hypothetical protein
MEMSTYKWKWKETVNANKEADESDRAYKEKWEDKILPCLRFPWKTNYGEPSFHILKN